MAFRHWRGCATKSASRSSVSRETGTRRRAVSAISRRELDGSAGLSRLACRSQSGPMVAASHTPRRCATGAAPRCQRQSRRRHPLDATGLADRVRPDDTEFLAQLVGKTGNPVVVEVGGMPIVRPYESSPRLRPGDRDRRNISRRPPIAAPAPVEIAASSGHTPGEMRNLDIGKGGELEGGSTHAVLIDRDAFGGELASALQSRIAEGGAPGSSARASPGTPGRAGRRHSQARDPWASTARRRCPRAASAGYSAREVKMR